MATSLTACPTNEQTTMIYYIDDTSDASITIPNCHHVIFIRTWDGQHPESLLTTFILNSTFPKIVEFVRNEYVAANNWTVTLKTSNVAISPQTYTLNMLNTSAYGFRVYCNASKDYIDVTGIQPVIPTINRVVRVSEPLVNLDS